MLPILDRLLFKETIKSLLIITSVLILVVFASTFVRYLGQVASGAIPRDILMSMLGTHLIKALGTILPPAFFFSILLVLGRMYRDGEMAAWACAGVGLARIYRAFAFSALPLALLVMALSMLVMPWAKGHSEQLRQMARESTDITVFKPGEFVESPRGDFVVFSERVNEDGNRLEGLFIQNRQHGKLGIITADEATQVVSEQFGHRYIQLNAGQRYEGEPGQGSYAIGQFSEYGLLVEEPKKRESSTSIEARASLELMYSSDLREWAEFQYRLSFPLAVLAFTLVSVPLARSLPRQSMYGRITLAVVIYFVFMNLQRIAQRWMVDGVTPAWLGIWWLPTLMAVVALLIAISNNRGLRINLRWFRRSTP